LTRVSCWTTLSRLFHDLEHAPALLLGDGARLGDADEVADAALVLGVVDLETRALLDSLATGASLAFLLLIVWPAFQYASDELPITTSALQITDAWRAAALPAGIGLMIVFALLWLTRAASAKTIILSLGLIALVVALFWLGAPLFRG